MRQTPQRPGSSFQDQYQQVTSDLLVDTVSPTRAAPNPFPLDVVNTSSQPAAAFVATSFPNPYIQQSSIATPQDKNPNTVSGAKAPPHGGLNASSDIQIAQAGSVQGSSRCRVLEDQFRADVQTDTVVNWSGAKLESSSSATARAQQVTWSSYEHAGQALPLKRPSSSCLQNDLSKRRSPAPVKSVGTADQELASSEGYQSMVNVPPSNFPYANAYGHHSSSVPWNLPSVLGLAPNTAQQAPIQNPASTLQAVQPTSSGVLPAAPQLATLSLTLRASGQYQYPTGGDPAPIAQVLKTFESLPQWQAHTVQGLELGGTTAVPHPSPPSNRTRPNPMPTAQDTKHLDTGTGTILGNEAPHRTPQLGHAVQSAVESVACAMHQPAASNPRYGQLSNPVHVLQERGGSLGAVPEHADMQKLNRAAPPNPGGGVATGWFPANQATSQHTVQPEVPYGNQPAKVPIQPAKGTPGLLDVLESNAVLQKAAAPLLMSMLQGKGAAGAAPGQGIQPSAQLGHSTLPGCKPLDLQQICDAQKQFLEALKKQSHQRAAAAAGVSMLRSQARTGAAATDQLPQIPGVDPSSGQPGQNIAHWLLTAMRQPGAAGHLKFVKPTAASHKANVAQLQSQQAAQDILSISTLMGHRVDDLRQASSALGTAPEQLKVCKSQALASSSHTYTGSLQEHPTLQWMAAQVKDSLGQRAVRYTQQQPEVRYTQQQPGAQTLALYEAPQKINELVNQAAGVTPSNFDKLTAVAGLGEQEGGILIDGSGHKCVVSVRHAPQLQQVSGGDAPLSQQDPALQQAPSLLDLENIVETVSRAQSTSTASWDFPAIRKVEGTATGFIPPPSSLLLIQQALHSSATQLQPSLESLEHLLERKQEVIQAPVVPKVESAHVGYANAAELAHPYTPLKSLKHLGGYSQWSMHDQSSTKTKTQALSAQGELFQQGQQLFLSTTQVDPVPTQQLQHAHANSVGTPQPTAFPVKVPGIPPVDEADRTSYAQFHQALLESAQRRLVIQQLLKKLPREWRAPLGNLSGNGWQQMRSLVSQIAAKDPTSAQLLQQELIRVVVKRNRQALEDDARKKVQRDNADKLAQNNG